MYNFESTTHFNYPWWAGDYLMVSPDNNQYMRRWDVKALNPAPPTTQVTTTAHVWDGSVTQIYANPTPFTANRNCWNDNGWLWARSNAHCAFGYAYVPPIV